MHWASFGSSVVGGRDMCWAGCWGLAVCADLLKEHRRVYRRRILGFNSRALNSEDINGAGLQQWKMIGTL